MTHEEYLALPPDVQADVDYLTRTMARAYQAIARNEAQRAQNSLPDKTKRAAAPVAAVTDGNAP